MKREEIIIMIAMIVFILVALYILIYGGTFGLGKNENENENTIDNINEIDAEDEDDILSNNNRKVLHNEDYYITRNLIL